MPLIEKIQMFFQGIFSTPIPYLIFAILYLVGLAPGAYSSIKTKIEQKNIEFHIGTEEDQEIEELFFFYQDDAFIETGTNVRSIDYEKALALFIKYSKKAVSFPELKIVSKNRLLLSDIIARPPPSFY